MHRYFFQLHYATRDVADPEVTELDGHDEAKTEARAIILELAAASFKRNREFDLISVRILNPEGDLLAEVFSREVLAEMISPDIITI